jgi:hypothetical protein
MRLQATARRRSRAMSGVRDAPCLSGLVRPHDVMLKSIARLFQSGKTSWATFHTNEFGHHYARIPAIVGSLDGDACPLLRAIVTDDLQCGPITEVSGEGDTWWDFTYKGTRFTCMLLVASCHGSELYPSSGTKSTTAERDLLGKLVKEIIRYADRRAV